jgi:hypothetical protein
MSDHDRGAYAPPTDAPLTFDARQPVRGSRPVPMTLIISVLVLAGLGVAIFLFYRQGARQAGQPPQAVGAPVAAMKAPPPAEAQPQDPAAGLQIYKTENGQAKAPPSGQPSFTPPPEQPVKRAEAPVVVAPPAQLAPAQAQPALRPALPSAPPAASSPPAPPPAKLAQAAPAPKPVTAPPAAKTEVTPPAKAAAATPAPAKEKAPPPAPAKTAAATPAPAAAPAKPAAAATGGSFVQIGAVSSQALADEAWTKAAAVAPGDAAGKGKNVEKVDRDGKTLYRVQMTGFASKADATAFCAKLKAAGKDCFAR